MSIVMRKDGVFLEAQGDHTRGWIMELHPNGDEIEMEYKYSCYAEAEEALIGIIERKQTTSH